MTRCAAGRRSRRSRRRADPARGGSAAGSPPPAPRPPTRSRRARRRAGRRAPCAAGSARGGRPARAGPASSAITAARQSNSRRPFFVIRSTRTVSVARNRSTAATSSADGRPEVDLPAARLEPVGQGASGRLHDLDDVEAVGQRLRERGVHAGGVDDLGEPDLEVLRLAGRPGRGGPGVGDAGVRVEARGVGHRHPGAEDRALEGPAEVAVAGEAEPASLGVPDPESLDGWGLLLGLVTHPASVGPWPPPSWPGTGRPCPPGCPPATS